MVGDSVNDARIGAADVVYFGAGGGLGAKPCRLRYSKWPISGVGSWSNPALICCGDHARIHLCGAGAGHHGGVRLGGLKNGCRRLETTGPLICILIALVWVSAQ